MAADTAAEAALGPPDIWGRLCDAASARSPEPLVIICASSGRLFKLATAKQGEELVPYSQRLTSSGYLSDLQSDLQSDLLPTHQSNLRSVNAAVESEAGATDESPGR